MHFQLAEIPDGAVARGVVVEQTHVDGRQALRVALDEATRSGTLGVDFIDQPTFLVLPISMSAGRLSVSVRSRLLADAPEYARGFAGLAFRVTDTQFESVYLRPLNGVTIAPEGPRRDRAVQYFSYPDWPFDRLRAERPDGGYESSADIIPNAWIRLTVEFDEHGVRASVDDSRVLEVDSALTDARPGSVALWVDIGTEAWFSDLDCDVYS